MVRIDNLVKNYGDFRLNVSMEIPAGRVSGLVGRNGMGKSTTIKAILGIVRPDGGSVLTLGKEARSLTAGDKCLIGTAMSDSGFSGYLNVKGVAKILGGFYKGFDEELFLRKCSMSGLPLKKQIKDFSTGMKAKLRVLAACSHGAKLLILDEPTAGLDVIARGEVLQMLRDYLAEDPECSMLITSHISSDLEGICDDIYLLNNGEIVLHEDTDVILSGYAVLRLSPKQYEEIDRSRILRTRKEAYGYACLTDCRQFYAENYPGVLMESGSIDEMIIMNSEGSEKA